MLLYSVVVQIYGFLIRFSALWDEKAAQWSAGRKNWDNKLTQSILNLGTGKRIWFHCASYGEFEQGRPLMEKIKQNDPTVKIILTFFSPSGYESFKNWKGADLILYLPLDTRKNAKKFLEILKPNISIFVKYEFWIHFLFAIKKQNIPCYLVSATFKDHHPFFRFYGRIFRKSLKSFSWLFLQDDHSAVLLKSINVTNCSVTGDTRFDRVMQIKQQFQEIPGIKEFKGNSQLIAAGSTWPKDDELLISAFVKLNRKDVKLLIAPHNLSEQLQKETEQKLTKAGLSFSLYSNGINNESQVLIVNTMGMLSRLYFYADCAYVGGGFNGGIHNTLEPAVYGIPVAFYGDDYVKYNEAVELVKRKAGVLVTSDEHLEQVFQSWLGSQETIATIKQTLTQYFDDNKNVTEKILEKIKI